MRSRPFALFAGVTLAVAVVVAFVVASLRESRDGALVNATDHADSTREVPTPATAEPAALGKTSNRLTPERTDDLAAVWNDASHDVVGPVIEGTIVVYEMREQKREEEEDGFFVPDFIDGQDSDLEEGARRRVAVKHGRFRFDARGGTVMLVTQLDLRGRPARVEHGVELTAGRPLALDAWWLDDVLLHVVDATTKRELDEVTVVRRDTMDGSANVELPGHPGIVHPVDLLRDGVRSPLHLTRGTATDQAMLMTGWIWVGARGHAWKRMTLDLERERERTVELGPGGALVVTVTEPADGNGADAVTRASDRWPHLRLRQPQAASVGSLFSDLAAEPEEFRLEGLEPGELTAAIEIGNPFPAPLIVSRAAVTIVAGATAHATLRLDPSKAPKPTTLAGTVYVPPAWGETELEITVAPLDLRGAINDDLRRTTRLPFEPIPGRPGWHTWSISPILPANYRLFVEVADFETTVAVGPEGRDDVTLTLPEPALLRVRLVDEETQGEIAVEELAWMPDEPAGGIDWDEVDRHRVVEMPTILKWSEPSRCCIGAVLPGRGQVQSMNVDFASAGVVATGEEFTVRAGVNDLVVHVRAPCGVELEFAYAGEVLTSVVVDWQRIGSSDPELSAIHVVHTQSFGLHPSRLYLPGPGRYRISRHKTAKGGADFTFEVDVSKGEFVKKTIELQKE